MPTVIVSDKGQVVIPASIRRRLCLGPGSKLDFELEGGSMRVRSRIVQVFEHLLGLEHVNTEEAERVAVALPLTSDGMDFADALHLSGNSHCETLYRFDDRRFARRARRLTKGTRVIVAPAD